MNLNPKLKERMDMELLTCTTLDLPVLKILMSFHASLSQNWLLFTHIIVSIVLLAHTTDWWWMRVNVGEVEKDGGTVKVGWLDKRADGKRGEMHLVDRK